MSLSSPLLDAPRLKAGVLHAQVEGGTYVELGDRSFLLRGDKLYPILARLLASLDGTRSAAEIRAALPEKLLPLYEQLFDQLLRQRMLTSGPDQAIPADHPQAATLAFVRESTSRWQACFAEWREARISISGSAALLPALARSLREAGAESVVLIADDAPADAELAALWLSPAAALQQPPAPRALLLHLGASAPDETTLAQLEALAAVHETSIVAAVCGEIGLVGPDCRGDLHTWRALAARATQDGQPFPRVARSVLASLLAFEALQQRITAWSDDADEAGRRRSQFRVVRNDGSVSSHDSETFLASGRGFAASAKDEPLAAAADPALGRFYDANAGIFSDAVVPGPEYPLAHRAVRLHYRSAAGEACEQLLYDWGPDPDAAEQRLMAHAFAALAAGRSGHAAAPGVSPLLAAVTPAQAQARATAYALATQPGFVDTHPPQPAEVRSGHGADTQMLARLVHLYTGGLPLAWQAGSAQACACLAWARIGDWTTAAIAADAESALFEALGEALSAFQLGRLGDRQMAWPLCALRGLRLPATAGEVAAITTVTPPPVQYEAADAALLPAGLHAGHARVAGA